MSIVKDLKVRVRINILTDAIKDPSEGHGRQGAQGHIIYEFPVMQMDEEELRQRCEDISLIIAEGYRVVEENVPPVVVTEDATDITTESAVLNSKVTSAAGNATTGFEISTSKDIGDSSVTSDEGIVNSVIPLTRTYAWSGLTPDTKYYYRAFAQTVGTQILQYGIVRSFTTLPTPTP